MIDFVVAIFLAILLAAFGVWIGLHYRVPGLVAAAAGFLIGVTMIVWSHEVSTLAYFLSLFGGLTILVVGYLAGLTQKQRVD